MTIERVGRYVIYGSLLLLAGGLAALYYEVWWLGIACFVLAWMIVSTYRQVRYG